MAAAIGNVGRTAELVLVVINVIHERLDHAIPSLEVSGLLHIARIVLLEQLPIVPDTEAHHSVDRAHDLRVLPIVMKQGRVGSIACLRKTVLGVLFHSIAYVFGLASRGAVVFGRR